MSFIFPNEIIIQNRTVNKPNIAIFWSFLLLMLEAGGNKRTLITSRFEFFPHSRFVSIFLMSIRPFV